MKKLFSLIIFSMLLSVGFSQSHDSRLLQKFSESELDVLKTNEPEEYQFLNTALEKAIFIGEIPSQKEKDISFDGELDIDPESEHNFISLGIDIKENHYQYFKITGTNKMVGVLPKSLIK